MTATAAPGVASVRIATALGLAFSRPSQSRPAEPQDPSIE
jgi:hypothetical protein